MKGYARHVRTVLVVVLALNAAVAVGKLVVGWRAGSLAVVGDGLHSAVDALGSLVALLVLRLATAPADADHPYGHAKFETVSALALAGLMGLTAFELGQASVGRLLSPSTPTYGTLTLAVMGATLAVNVGVVWLEGREARRTGSALLAADARHTRGDVLVTVAILASVPLQRLGFARLDAGLALAVSVLIAHAAWTVLREALPVLTDRIVHDPA
ncbi:MAG TPA: cation diffusion facilitator family transporter, partial [Candidatus Thermoplasmatota archaeon]|nr:cation diffusion facilitator family transporter [Candidatus Thermoplasmatota archaeon]